jgi:hypothetical protein
MVPWNTDAAAVPPAPAPRPALLHATTSPMWTHTPHLAHLQFDFPNGILMEAATHDAALVSFVRAIFATWLDVWRAACPLRVMRICAREGLLGRGSAQASAAWATAWAGDVPRVALEIAEMSAGLVATDARLLWGASI